MDNESEKKPTVWQVVASVLAAFFGVQSDKARQRDFSKGNPWAFIMVGLVIVTLLVLGLYALVQWIVGISVGGV